MPFLPNLLATPRGRLAAFFLLYVTEGIPLGFIGTAVAYQLRKMGVGPAEIGAFVGSFYLPWAFKWAFGPFVDTFRSKRLGHYRAWILGMQLLMVSTLVVLVAVPLPAGLATFAAILFVHNLFAATQDVAIDALACNTLREDERGLANGLMFAGAAIGTAVGGAGVLALTPYTGFSATFFFVGAALLLITFGVVWPMREPLTEAPVRPAGQGVLAHAGGEMRKFAVDAFRAFLGTRGAYAGVLFNLLPAGAMALGLALRTTMSAEFGLPESEAAQLELWSNVISAAGMVVGGWASDRYGRRRTLFVYILLMSMPTLWLAWRLQQLGYVMPVTVGADGIARQPLLASALWGASLLYQFFMGLMYGTRSAIMMDVTTPKVAGTQFTAYMAMANLAIAYSATWQGVSAEALGYPKTLLIDAALGLASLSLLPMLTARAAAEPADRPPRRARLLAACMALVCLLWLPLQAGGSALGPWQGIAGTFMSLGFMVAALVLVAGHLLLPASVSTRLAPWAALGLVLLAARQWLAPLTGVWGLPLAVLGALTLALLARQSWDSLRA